MKLEKDSALLFLLNYWARYCPVDASHREWLHTYAQVIEMKRGTLLFEPDEDGRHRDYLYLVCDGLLATLWWDLDGRRRIDRLLLPGDTVLTTRNLYTNKQVYYFVAALRRSTVIRIPADALRAYKESCREADTLVDVMEQKKLKQYRAKNRLMLMKDERERYAEFVRDDYMKPLRLVTSQQEHADYLNISRITITRVNRDI
ncbi:hypothetical protein GCM10011386_03060 [Parapedobacter defluvii]|uniref:cAMP-binding domain of CRP or a regulatory subunit of cAMP-dependent protein kinases n=1 Tax=Parapedobacter defluvii TaxID=2045106 RepID=A0ABQ1KYI2_9SPHI|nr:Crp/Fnr family transcriptional regulator [Parapedobacter defluvii]GGC14724.1 hypothetical protein GCM10011386_03060 [Parapedobacter defluvii]